MNINPIGVASGLVDSLAKTPPQWGGISPHLLGRLTMWDMNAGRDELDDSGRKTGAKTGAEKVDGPVIACPVTDLNLEMSLNWQSPFEQSGPESKAPTLMALLQSGQLGPVVNAFDLAAGHGANQNSPVGNAAAAANSAISSLVGKTGITKLNSRQVFSGMPPVKLSCTLHFRAISNPGKEVMQPYAQLLKWALPQKLAKNGTIANVINAAPSGVQKMVEQLFPSVAPQLVCFVHGNNKYAPMVIEHISNPLSDHLGITGQPVYRSVQISLSTLTALDANDVANILKKGSLL